MTANASSARMHLTAGLRRQEHRAGFVAAAPAGEPAAPKLWLNQLSQTYRSTNNGDLVALNCIELKVRPGEFVCIVGPSGWRVALARALATNPDVLLMDEPFAALDAQTRDLLHDELERIWEETGRTIVFVTHNVREAVRLGNRVVLITFRPGTVKREFRVDLFRPRHLEDIEVANTAREVLDELREEINKSIEAEYCHEEKIN